MNEIRPLPIHPLPFPTEGLLGYVLRLFSLNGCRIPSSFQQLSTLSPIAFSDWMIDREQLSALTLHPTSVFKQIAIKHGPAQYEMLGHQISSVEVRDTDAKFCPACAREKGFIQTHFQLSLMTGCPEHKRRLLSVCPACSKTVRWTRPGILECNCSHDLSDAEPLPLPDSEAALLDIVRRKTLGLDPSSYSVAIPAANLAKMKLASLLGLIRVLGKFRLFAFGQQEPYDDAAVLSAAVGVLNYWPKCFYDLLTDLGFSYRTRRGESVKTGMERLWDALLVQAWQGEMEFIDEAIETFYQQSRRRLEENSDARERRWLSRRERLFNGEIRGLFDDVESAHP